MQELLQSAFLQALAYSLLASVWQMGLLWLITVTALKLFRFSSAQKFNIAFTAQLSGFLLFIYTCFNAYSAGAKKIIIYSENTAGVVSGINAFITTAMPYAAMLYLGVLIYNVIKLAFIFNDTQQLKKHNLKKISAEYRIFVQQVSEMFSIHRKVRIYLSEKIVCPLTTGFFKPVILIPVAAVNHLTTEQMEAVILHELAHIKRFDYILYILQSLVEKVFFFNVFSAMLGEIIERERENACDDWVLQFRYNSMHYAEALFKLGRLKALPVLAIPLQGKKESLLLQRVKRLLHNPQPRSAYNFQFMLLGFASMIITLGLLVSPPAKPTKEFTGINGTTANVASKQNKIIQVAEATQALQPAPEPTATRQVRKEKQAMASLQQSSPAAVQVKTEVPEIAVRHRENAMLQLQEKLQLNQNYVYKVKMSLDSIRQQITVPQVNAAVVAKVELNEQMLQKAMSYQNFKQIEAMLAASGDSINVIENEASKNSYRKQITIESLDKKGNKHIYNVIVELYQ